MNTYSQSGANGNVMPFIMGSTKPTPIEAMDCDEKIIYDPITQSTIVNMRIVGTRSLKCSTTMKKTRTSTKAVSDKKNEIDDSKNVK